MSRDPGVQPERTALAWHRTALTMLVNGALLVRSAAETQSPLAWTVSILVSLAAMALFFLGWHRGRALLQATSRSSSPHAGVVIMLAVAVWFACAAEMLSIVLELSA